METGTHFEIVDSCAKMSSSCWGRYRRVAVLEVRNGYTAKTIDDRPKHVVRIVETWEKLFQGTSDRCAHAKARAAAKALVAKLEAEREGAAA